MNLAQPFLFEHTQATAAPAPASLTLRPYQQRALAGVRERRRPGVRVLVVAPTGAGKTVIGSQLVLDELAAGGRVLFLAHRQELIAQTYGKLLVMGLDERELGVIMGDGIITHPVTRRRVCCERRSARVQVASIDTLRNRPKPPGITLVIIDESHRALAKSYRDVVATYPSALVVGLTATPYRGDGRGLGDLFNDLLVVAQPRELIADGFLAEPRVFSHPVKPDLSTVKITAGDYNAEQLDAAVNKSELVGNIVEHWRKHLDGVRTVAFAASVAHSKNLTAAFNDNGIPAEHLDGETAPELRAALLGRLDRGETLVVSNAMVLVEGWDQPAVKGCILACPTKSPTKYIQCAGRVLRPYQGQTPVILDHGGCAIEHDLPHVDREYSLEGRKKREKSAVNVVECPQCFGASPKNTAVCPYCGTPLAKTKEAVGGRTLEERDGELVELVPGMVPLAKLPPDIRALRHEIQIWAGRVDDHHGYQPGTTNGRLMRRFGKSRSAMSVAELEEVRAHLLLTHCWLAAPPLAHEEPAYEPEPEPAPPPVRRPRLVFSVPQVAGGRV